VLTMHPTLLIGPADWDAARFPREEFAARVATLWQACDGDVAGAVVFGSPRHHAELSWLTHFTPKLESGLALIGRRGPPRLFIGGGVSMLDSARPLTWIDDLLPLRGVAKALRDWRRELGGRARLVLIGGDAMPFGLHRDITAALGVDTIDITSRLAPLMARKSARELAAIEEACATLDGAFGAIGKAWRSGAAVANAMLAAEQAANRRGAQDVRTLFSADGGHTLMPFTVLDARRIAPLQVYVAVRQHGYWVDGFQLFCDSPNAALAAARAALIACTAPPGIGRSRGEVAASLAAACASGGRRVHPVVAGELVKPVGLALEAPPGDDPDGDLFAANSVYSARAGVIIGSEAAIVSSTLFF
jgi:hypothetical protein